MSCFFWVSGVAILAQGWSKPEGNRIFQLEMCFQVPQNLFENLLLGTAAPGMNSGNNAFGVIDQDGQAVSMFNSQRNARYRGDQGVNAKNMRVVNLCTGDGLNEPKFRAMDLVHGHKTRIFKLLEVFKCIKVTGFISAKGENFWMGKAVLKHG